MGGEDDAESVKIQQQTVASPIFFWKDIDIWLYMLALVALTVCLRDLILTNGTFQFL